MTNHGKRSQKWEKTKMITDADTDILCGEYEYEYECSYGCTLLLLLFYFSQNIGNGVCVFCIVMEIC